MTLAQRTFAEIEVQRARRHDPATSKAAARESHGLAAEHRLLILGALRDGGARDWTPGEIAAVCKLASLQVSRRIHGLWEDGLIRESGATRPTPSGRAARCWELVRT